MTWQAPWVWLGLIAVAFPVVIHLLGRGHARRLPFPTLRFFGITRSLPTRRTRLRDLVLLAVHIAILAAAVAALAQPLLLTAHRKGEFDASLARAVIVDTSASMQRRTPAGERAIDVALQVSQRLADSAAPGIVLRTASPARAIAGAVAWLGRQAGRGEIVVVSDFQAGALDAADIATIPAHIGVRLVPIRASAGDTPLVTHARYGNVDVTARIVLSLDRTDVEWAASPVPLDSATSGVTLLAGATEAAAAEAARHAASTMGVPLPLDTGRRIVVVFPSYPERATLWRGATALRSAWMSDVVVRLRADPVLAAAGSSVMAATPVDSARATAAVRNEQGRPVVLAATGTVGGHEVLLLFPLVEAGSLTSAALIVATNRALSVASPVAELDPATLPDSTLTAWQRAPTRRSTPGPGDSLSDGRWLWVLALVLLGIEALLRRGRAMDGETRITHEANA